MNAYLQVQLLFKVENQPFNKWLMAALHRYAQRRVMKLILQIDVYLFTPVKLHNVV